MNSEKILKEIEEGMSVLRQTISAEAYNKGLNDAWELAKKLDLLDCSVGEQIFGTYKLAEVFTKYTPQEALAKLEVYKKEQASIKVGDVVKNINTGEAVVLQIRLDGLLNIYSIKDGMVRIGWNKTAFKKTGKHIDIQSVLGQIGGGQGES